jgi:protein-S-isoprenylcysteine O-methyltransferase Ste14
LRAATRWYPEASRGDRPSSALVNAGPYSFSRNPTYLGIGLLLPGVAAPLGSITPFAVPFLFCIAMDILFIRPEELMPESQFVESFIAYRSRIRRWL